MADTQTLEPQVKPEKPARKKQIKYPTKNTLNLYVRKRKKLPPEQLIPMLAVILLLTLALGKFGVYDRWQRVADAQAQLDQQQAQLQGLQKQVDSYAGVEEEYSRYTYTNFSAATLALADRPAVLSMIERLVFPVSAVQSLELSGNQLTARISNITLKNLNQLQTALEQETLVSAVKAETAVSDATVGEPKPLTAVMIITLADNRNYAAAEGGAK